MKIAGLVIFLLGLIAFILLLILKIKRKLLEKLSTRNTLITVICLALFTFVGFMLFSYGLSVGNTAPMAGRLVEMIFTTLLIPADVFFIFTSLWLRAKAYPLDDNNKKTHKLLKIFEIVGAVLLIPLVFCYFDSITPYLPVPFPKLIIDFGNGHGLTFYAAFIIVGLIVAYIICDHKIHQAGYPHGLFENLLYIAFPAGIVGARIWYVIAEWNDKFAGQPFTDVFAIWDGGLAIHGGIVLGAAAGIIYMMKAHKDVPILLCIDIIFPTILLAQAIGRWGNFMNAEVYGYEVARASWGFLPEWMLNQLAYSAKVEGNIVLPLFLIEGCLNIAGYFLIVYGVGKGLKKFIVPGDIGALFLVTTGLIRFILEPMRNETFQMGVTTDGVVKSQVTSGIFIGLGILAIVALHILDYLNKRDKKKAVVAADNENIEKENDENVEEQGE